MNQHIIDYYIYLGLTLRDGSYAKLICREILLQVEEEENG